MQAIFEAEGVPKCRRRQAVFWLALGGYPANGESSGLRPWGPTAGSRQPKAGFPECGKFLSMVWILPPPPSTVWKVSFHGVEPTAAAVHGVESFFPRRGPFVRCRPRRGKILSTAWNLRPLSSMEWKVSFHGVGKSARSRPRRGKFLSTAWNFRPLPSTAWKAPFHGVEKSARSRPRRGNKFSMIWKSRHGTSTAWKVSFRAVEG